MRRGRSFPVPFPLTRRRRADRRTGAAPPPDLCARRPGTAEPAGRAAGGISTNSGPSSRSPALSRHPLCRMTPRPALRWIKPGRGRCAGGPPDRVTGTHDDPGEPWPMPILTPPPAALGPCRAMCSRRGVVRTGAGMGHSCRAAGPAGRWPSLVGKGRGRWDRMPRRRWATTLAPACLGRRSGRARRGTSRSRKEASTWSPAAVRHGSPATIWMPCARPAAWRGAEEPRPSRPGGGGGTVSRSPRRCRRRSPVRRRPPPRRLPFAWVSPESPSRSWRRPASRLVGARSSQGRRRFPDRATAATATLAASARAVAPSGEARRRSAVEMASGRRPTFPL